MTNIAVFASGNGTNAVNLVKAFNSGSRIRVAMCLTDKENAPVIEKMRELGVDTLYFPRSIWNEKPQEILEVLRAHNIRIIALAGFLCYVDNSIVEAYKGMILNIHPSLLPAYGGKGMHGANIHRAVIEAGETKSGVTVHIVTNEVDAGPIIVQREIEVLPDDTPETLEAKIHELEYEVFPEAILTLLSSLSASSSPTPPPVPKSVDDAWAETLGIPNRVPEQPAVAKAPVAAQTAAFNTPVASSNTAASVAPDATTTQKPAMPPTFLVWSVLATVLCCTIPGIVAIIKSAQVSSKFYQGDTEGSARASRQAEIWIIVSFVLGVISQTLYLPLTIAGLF